MTLSFQENSKKIYYSIFAFNSNFGLMWRFNNINLCFSDSVSTTSKRYDRFIYKVPGIAGGWKIDPVLIYIERKKLI